MKVIIILTCIVVAQCMRRAWLVCSRKQNFVYCYFWFWSVKLKRRPIREFKPDWLSIFNAIEMRRDQPEGWWSDHHPNPPFLFLLFNWIGFVEFSTNALAVISTATRQLTDLTDRLVCWWFFFILSLFAFFFVVFCWSILTNFKMSMSHRSVMGVEC